jgi:hypothetical protein
MKKRKKHSNKKKEWRKEREQTKKQSKNELSNHPCAQLKMAVPQNIDNLFHSLLKSYNTIKTS